MKKFKACLAFFATTALLSASATVLATPGAVVTEDVPFSEYEYIQETDEEKTQAELSAYVKASGNCGENVTWTLDDEGTLTISGTGAMYDYWYDFPWCSYDYRMSIKKAVISDGVTRIGTQALYNCSNLTEITISNSVTSIGDYVFDFCEKLPNITIPDSVTRIGDWAFGDCDSLESIIIPSSVTKIGIKAFDYSDNVTIYGEKGSYAETYAKNYNIPFVDLEEKVPNVIASGTCGENVTWTLDDEGTLTISGNGEISEFDCGFSGDLNVIISEGVTKICSQAFDFRGCEINSMKFQFPASLEKIEGYAFVGCDNVTISINPDNSSFKLIDDVLYTADMKSLVYASSSKTGDFIVPSSVMNVCDGAFASSSLTSVTIPNTVVSMVSDEHGRVFAHANCKRVYIGKNVAYLDRCCFYCCENLEEVYVYGLETGAEEFFIGYCENVTLYINRNSEMADCSFDEDFKIEYMDDYSTSGVNQSADFDDDGEITDSDAIFLMYYTFFPEEYSINVNSITIECDFNGDGVVDDADAIYLMYHTFFPEQYPLSN